MTKSKQRQSLSGTVLIMILTVMFVLIIMLMATLTVVTTASQRIYTKFEENQAYYTSRSALEVITKKLLNDNSYISTNSDIGDGSADEYQGFQMQAALYRVIVEEPDGTRDPDKNIDIYGDVDKDCIEYLVTLPALGNASDRYGNFSDGNQVYVKMEVLDRVYDADSSGDVDNGNRADDMLKVKITAVSELNGVEGTASVLIETGPSKGANNTTRAVTTLADTTMDPNNNAILGGIVTRGDITFGNDGDYWGNVYVGGNLTQNTGDGTKVTLIGEEWYYIKGDMTYGDRAPLLQGITVGTSSPVVFVDGNFTAGGYTTTTVTAPMMLVVDGNFNLSANDFKHYGDIYVTGDFTSNASHPEITGNLHVGGNITISSGDLKIHGDLHTSKQLKYYDYTNLTVDGTVHYADATAFDDAYAGSATPANSFGTADLVSVNDTDPAQLTITSSQNVLNKVLPMEVGLYTQFYRYGDLTEGCITASEYAFTSQEEFDSHEYSDKRIHEYYDEKLADPTTITITGGGRHENPGCYYMPGLSNGTVEFDANGEVELFLEPDQFYGNDAKVIVHDGTILKVYCIPGNYTFTKIWFGTNHAFNTTDRLYVGDSVDPAVVGDPNAKLMDIPITFYIEGTSNLTLDQSSHIIGHIYAPRATVDAGTSGTENYNDRLWYNSIPYDAAHRRNGGYCFTIIGSVLANRYITGQSSKGSVAYVKTETADIPPQEGYPFLTFQEVKYSRN